MKKINLGYRFFLFPLAALILALGFIVMPLNPDLGIILVIGSPFLLIIKAEIQIDLKKKRIRKVTVFLETFHFGKWISLENKVKLNINHLNNIPKQNFVILSNKSYANHYALKLVDKQNAAIIFHEFIDLDHANQTADILFEYFGIVKTIQHE